MTLREQKVKQFQQYLEEHKACWEARQWAKGKTLEEAWMQCCRPQWMKWLIQFGPTRGDADKFNDIGLKILEMSWGWDQREKTCDAIRTMCRVETRSAPEKGN